MQPAAARCALLQPVLVSPAMVVSSDGGGVCARSDSAGERAPVGVKAAASHSALSQLQTGSCVPRKAASLAAAPLPRCPVAYWDGVPR